MSKQDRLFESHTFAQALPLERFKRPVLLAPHPDDEVFGAGGLLALWAQLGVPVQVLVLTGGQSQGHHTERQAESQAAAAYLGGYALEFWQLPDRELRATPDLVERIAAYLQAQQADLVLIPGLHEPHPDHQACALATLWALAKLPQVIDLCFYESGSALIHCTHLVDITSVESRKMRAMQAFGSQEEVQPYSSRIASLNHFRALTLGPEAQAAEGFQWLPLSQQGWAAALPALDPLFLHHRGQAVLPHELPLVSVLIRTVGDPHLEQAIASVLLQSYPCIEIVVVAAHGQSEPPATLAHTPQLRWVSQQKNLTRPQAANAALDAAQGQYCVFLDDDDLFTPDHVEKLVQALQAQMLTHAAHTDTQVVNAQGQEILRYEQAYRPERLVFTNVFPIHSVLFDRQFALKQGCRFEEDLPVLEDWDFWLQLSRHTTFTHTPGCSAIYRYRDRSQLQTDNQHANYHQRWRERVMNKWLARLPIEEVVAAGAWYAQQLDHFQQHSNHWEQQAQHTQRALAETQQDLHCTRHELAENRQALSQVQHELAEIHSSRGWRLLGILRRLKRGLLGSRT